MNKLILSCLLSAAAISASATELTVTYTYAGDASSTWGRSKAQIYDAAIRINDPALVGKKITSIRALINPDAGVEETSLWLSKELKLEKIDGVKRNIPDSYSVDVAVEPTEVSGMAGTCGQLYTELDTPYVITEEGIYAGYSLTVPAAEAGQTLTAAQNEPILLSRSTNPNSLYLRLSKDFVNWQAYNSKTDGAAMIYVTIEGDFPDHSVDIKPEIPFTYVPIDEDFTVKAVLSNTGLSEAKQIGYSYTIGGKEYEKVLDLDAPIPSNFINVASSEVQLPIDAVDATGDYTLDLRITSVNGQPNLSAANSASAKIRVIPFVPVHRPMLEEFTGTWCGWCTRGYIAMEVLNDLYGDAVTLAAYHNGDYMAMKEYPVKIGGFPCATLNRGGVMDPYHGFGGANDGFQTKKLVAQSMGILPDAEIYVNASWADDAKKEINVNASSKFLYDFADADYKVGYLLINNGLTGTGTGWLQNNNYSGDSSCIGTELEPLMSWPSKAPVPYNDVVVDITGMMGVEGSVPADIVANTLYETSFSFDISDNGIVQDKDQLYVAAFIINPDGSILNSRRVKVGSGAGVGSVDGDAQEVSAEYYTLSGMRVANPGKGAYIKVAKMADGTVRSKKVFNP